MSCLVGEGGGSLSPRYIANMSLKLGLKPSKKVPVAGILPMVVLVVWLESDFIAYSAKLNLDLG